MSGLLAFAMGIPFTSKDPSKAYDNFMFSFLDLVFSLSSAILGGFVTGKIDRDNFSLNSAVAGTLLWLLLVGSYFASHMAAPVWYTVSWIFATIPAVYFGAKLAARENSRN